MQAPVVTVVIPAFNAAETLAETLRSAAAQTLRDLEILVVDDGSRDATADLTLAAGAADARIRLIRTANGGVAAARNRGIAEARGDFVAPLDADDLWHPAKLERQLAVFRDGPADLGFVYSNHRLIDADSRVIATPAPLRLAGRVFIRHVAHNIVGNGSAIMAPTALARAVGYEPRLRAEGVEGCEDYLFQLKLARSRPVGVAPGHLVGYRKLPGAMSSDGVRMLRSRLLALRMLADDDETPPAILAETQAVIRFWLGMVHIRGGDLAAARFEMAEALRAAPPGSPAQIAAYIDYRANAFFSRGRLAGLGRRFTGRAAARPLFADMDPAPSPGQAPAAYISRIFAERAAADAAYARPQP